MPKRNLSIRKNSRSNKNKNKIPKKSKKPVIKKGVKGKGKIKGRAKVNKRVVKSKHLQRKHSKNKNEKKRKYSKKKNRMIGGYLFTYLDKIDTKNRTKLETAIAAWEAKPTTENADKLENVVLEIEDGFDAGTNEWNEAQDILALLDEYRDMTEGESIVFTLASRVYTGSTTVKNITSTMEKLRQEGMIPLETRGMRAAKDKVLNLINSAPPQVFAASVNLNPTDTDEFNFLKLLSRNFADIWVRNIGSVHFQLESVRDLNKNSPIVKRQKVASRKTDIIAAARFIQAQEHQPYPYSITDSMLNENRRDNFGGGLRDLATKYWDTTTSCTNLNIGGGTINALAEWYRAYRNDLKIIWERYYKDPWGGQGIGIYKAPGVEYTYRDIFDLSYNYIRDRGNRYCYISGEISPNVLSLEHKYAYFDGLILGILVSEKLHEEALHWLGEADLKVWRAVVLILHPLAAARPNERKSNQGLLNTVVIQDRAGNFIIQMKRLPEEYYKSRAEGRQGTACWWGLKDSDGNDNGGGWYQTGKSRYTPEQIRTLQNNFLDAVIGTVNELLQSNPRVSEFLLLWTGYMVQQFDSFGWAEYFYKIFNVKKLKNLANMDLVKGQCGDFAQDTPQFKACADFVRKRQSKMQKERSSSSPWNNHDFVGAS